MADSASTQEEYGRTAVATYLPAGKRKRDPQQSPSNPKLAKRKRQKRGKNTDDPDIDYERGINSALGRLDRHLLADYLSQKTKQFSDSLSLSELEDKRIPGIYSYPVFID